MAVELDQFLKDQLARLPAEHPDRPYLEGVAQSVAAFVERTDPALMTELWQGTPTVAPPAEVTPPPPAEQPTAAESAEQERVVLRGRLGKQVRYSTTPKGVRRAEFNLAVAVDADTTNWHTVLAFRERAERLEAASPKSGQYAEVIGYRKTEERRTRGGEPKTVERIIAAHIRLR